MDPIKDAAELPEAQEKPVRSFRTVPNELVRPMPVQDLGRWEGHRREKQSPSHPSMRFRRSLIVLATLVITAAASYEMYQVLSVRSLTALQIALLVAFPLNFVWIALPFVQYARHRAAARAVASDAANLIAEVSRDEAPVD